jgi:hypothetical protein
MCFALVPFALGETSEDLGDGSCACDWASGFPDRKIYYSFVAIVQIEGQSRHHISEFGARLRNATRTAIKESVDFIHRETSPDVPLVPSEGIDYDEVSVRVIHRLEGQTEVRQLRLVRPLFRAECPFPEDGSRLLVLANKGKLIDDGEFEVENWCGDKSKPYAMALRRAIGQK